MGISRELALDLFNIKVLTQKDKDGLHLLIIDFFAAAYAGYKQNRVFNTAVERYIFSQEGIEEATVFPGSKKLPASKAAFMNALYGHGAELDDGNRKAMGHVGVHVIPAVFALAEKIGALQGDVLLALAVGYEAYIRISSAAQPGMVQRGFHSTGAAGTLACAAACASLYGLDAEGIEDAIALATTMSGGLLSYGESRPAIKPLNPARAAETGVIAAELAKNGIKGPSEALEGPNGWFHAVTESYDVKMLQGAEDGHLLLHDCYIKLYPSCRHTHCGIEAAINLHNKIVLEDIEKVEVYIYPNAIKLAGQILYPQDQDETKFSIHYTLACALKNGQYGIDDMRALDMSSGLVEIINKIQLIPDETMENRDKGIRGTRVKLILKDGRSLEETILIPKGDPEKPLSREDILEKLYVCASGHADELGLRQLITIIETIDENSIFRFPTI